jgi:hypothetical protein
LSNNAWGGRKIKRALEDCGEAFAEAREIFWNKGCAKIDSTVVAFALASSRFRFVRSDASISASLR